MVLFNYVTVLRQNTNYQLIGFLLFLSAEIALWHQTRMHQLFTVPFAAQFYLLLGLALIYVPFLSISPQKNEQAVCFLLRRKERESENERGHHQQHQQGGGIRWVVREHCQPLIGAVKKILQRELGSPDRYTHTNSLIQLLLIILRNRTQPNSNSRIGQKVYSIAKKNDSDLKVPNSIFVRLFRLQKGIVNGV